MPTVTEKLYELADLRDVLDLQLAETGGEITPDLAAKLDELEGKTSEKVERVALYIREQLAMADAIDAEAKRLTQRAQAKRHAADSLKDYLKRNLERLEIARVDGLLCTVAIVKNSQPSVVAELDAETLYGIDDARPFVKRTQGVVTYTIDKARVLEAWKANPLSVPTCIFVERGSHVRIG